MAVIDVLMKFKMRKRRTPGPLWGTDGMDELCETLVWPSCYSYSWLGTWYKYIVYMNGHLIYHDFLRTFIVNVLR